MFKYSTWSSKRYLPEPFGNTFKTRNQIVFYRDFRNRIVASVVTQPRVWADRVSDIRGARCGPLMAPVGVSWRTLSTCDTTAALSRRNSSGFTFVARVLFSLVEILLLLLFYLLLLLSLSLRRSLERLS